MPTGYAHWNPLAQSSCTESLFAFCVRHQLQRARVAVHIIGLAAVLCCHIGLAEHSNFSALLYLRLYKNFTLVSLVDANTPSSNAIHLFSST